MMCKHFLQLNDLKKTELIQLIHEAIELKKNDDQRLKSSLPLQGKSVGMIFSQPSTRTRLSFEVGIHQLGGHCVFLTEKESQISRGESPEDTARVLSSMLDLVIIRHPNHMYIESLANHASISIINALSDQSHPCQLLADMQTFYELKGPIEGKKVAWVGDFNNMYLTYVEAARMFNFNLQAAIPPHCIADVKLPKDVHIKHDPKSVCHQADLVVTDAWSSMSDDSTPKPNNQEDYFSDYQVNDSLMQVASKDALFMHCLPAYRDQEVSSTVLNGTQSAVWQAVGNRLHAQKAVMKFLLK